MSRVCHECGYNVQNPFHAVSGVVRKDAQTAYTNMEVSLCDTEYGVIKPFLLNEAPEGTCFGVDGVTGSLGGFSNSVQLTGAYEKHGTWQYLSMEDAQRLLPKTARDLLNEPEWYENTGDTWKEASWVK